MQFERWALWDMIGGEGSGLMKEGIHGGLVGR